MRIRGLREEDHARIVRVVNGWWGGRRVSDKLPRLFLRHFGDTSFVAEDGGEIVGFLVGFVSQSRADEAYIHFVGVHPEHRGRGIGERLYGLFFEEVGRRGRMRIRCITSPVNKGSIAFHGRMGFRVEPGDREDNGVTVHSDYDGDDAPKVVFVREIP